MEVDFSFLADTAEAVNGKLYLVGGAFDTIWAPQMPVVHPRMSFVMRLVLSPAELGREHNLEVNVMDEDGKRITSIGAILKIEKKNPTLPRGWKQTFLTVLNFVNLKFSKFGDYSFEVVVNGSSMKSVSLHLGERVNPQVV
jgi:hypothetical protein